MDCIQCGYKLSVEEGFCARCGAPAEHVEGVEYKYRFTDEDADGVALPIERDKVPEEGDADVKTASSLEPNSYPAPAFTPEAASMLDYTSTMAGMRAFQTEPKYVSVFADKVDFEKDFDSAPVLEEEPLAISEEDNTLIVRSTLNFGKPSSLVIAAIVATALALIAAVLALSIFIQPW